MVFNFKFRFYNTENGLYENPNIFHPQNHGLPIIERALEPCKNVYFIQTGTVYVMDFTGMYSFGIL